MKKHLNTQSIIFLLTMLCYLPLHAQLPEWAVSGGGRASDNSSGIATDLQGNVYITGYFADTVTFGNIALVSQGGQDAYVVKYDKGGRVVWAKNFGTAYNDYGSDIDVDLWGNVYITGSVAEGPDSSFSFTDLYIAKYTPAGRLLWTSRESGKRNLTSGIAIDTDPYGGVYVTGSISNTATFGTTTLTASGFNDAVLVKADALTGRFLWARSGGSADSDLVNSVATDLEGNVYIGGTFFGTSATFGTVTFNNTSRSSFIVKYDRRGEVLWGRDFGTIFRASNFGDITTDISGNVYATGFVEHRGYFGSDTITTVGTADYYLVKYNSRGDYRWVRQGGSTRRAAGQGLTADYFGNVYLTGYFNYSLSPGKDTLTTDSNFEVFAAKYSGNGEVWWATAAGGQGYQNAIDIAYSLGSVYLTGNYFPQATFGTQTLSSVAGSTDIFVVKLSDKVWCLPVAHAAQFNAFPNAFREYTTFTSDNGTVQGQMKISLYDGVTGRLVHTEAFAGDLVLYRNGLEAGIYIYVLEDEEGVKGKGRLQVLE